MYVDLVPKKYFERAVFEPAEHTKEPQQQQINKTQNKETGGNLGNKIDYFKTLIVVVSVSYVPK